MKTITMSHAQGAAEQLAHRLSVKTQGYRIWGIPRGGVSVALLLCACTHRFELVDRPEQADIIVDDLIASGSTMGRFKAAYPDKVFAALFIKGTTPLDHREVFGMMEENEWLVFPWEQTCDDGESSDIPVRLLEFIGEDPSREGLRETPVRFIKAWQFWTNGYGIKPADVLKTFEDGSESYDEILVQRDIPIYSHCEHHLAPFFGVAHIAYMPDKKIVGLSKLSRLVDVFSRRLQVQERLTTQIADSLHDALHPRGVAVVLECRHMCMESRGVQRAGTVTMTSALRGQLKEAAARAEVFTLMMKGR